LSLVHTPPVLNIALPELARRGFVEGQNLVLDIRSGTEEQLPKLAEKLIGTKPDVILAVSDWAVIPARNATKSIPIVAAPMGADPVALGIARSWARPGGNFTGVTLIAPDLEIKRLALLREVIPAAHRIALLSMHRKVTEPGEAPVRTEAKASNMQLIEFYLDEPNQAEQAFSAMRAANVEGLVIVPVPELNAHLERLANLALKSGFPTICGFRQGANQGCLIGYGPDLTELIQQAADDVARIFQGASPGDLPIQGPTHYGFGINLKTAKALGIDVPQSLLARSDEVIE
jgi:putative tryptophan/tyrosine transport system substrate-binding protein